MFVVGCGLLFVVVADRCLSLSVAVCDLSFVVVRCSLFNVCCWSLFVVYCLLSVMRGSLIVVCFVLCVLYVDVRLLCVVFGCSLFVAVCCCCSL